MKVLDYTGLTRLAYNIKSYIASAIKPVDERAPFYSDKLYLVAGEMFDNSSGSILDNNISTTITGADTGAKKAFFDRLMKGLPSALLVKYGAGEFTHTVPFYLDEKSADMPTASLAIYRGRGVIANFDQLKITVNRYPTQSVIVEVAKYEKPEDTSYLMPFHLKLFSVSASGTTSPSTMQTLSESSTGEALSLYKRLQLGLPPAFRIDVPYSDGSTKSVWLYQKSSANSFGNVIFESGTIANGSYSDKILRLTIFLDKMQVLLRMVNVATS